MQLTIELPDNISPKLKSLADKSGHDVNSYIQDVVLSRLYADKEPNAISVQSMQQLDSSQSNSDHFNSSSDTHIVDDFASLQAWLNED